MFSMRAGLVVVTALATSACNMVKGPPRDHECRSTLRQIIGLENAYFSQHQKYSVHPVEIGWAPSQGNRYLYVFAAEGQLTRRDELPSPPLAESVGYGPDTKKRGVLLEDLEKGLPGELRAALGLHEDELTVACVGNIDEDPQFDVWSISTRDRDGAPRGTPIHHVKDLE